MIKHGIWQILEWVATAYRAGKILILFSSGTENESKKIIYS